MSLKMSIFGLLLLLIVGCGTTKLAKSPKYSIKYLDDYILPANTTYDHSTIGGLSGIDYNGDYFVMVCDQSSSPRLYNSTIQINDKAIDTIIITRKIAINTTDSNLDIAALDMEGIRFTKSGISISTEGNIEAGIDPIVFQIDNDGNFLSKAILPDYFSTNNSQKPRHNGVFEGLTNDWETEGFWIATELPLLEDGPTPKIYNTSSPVRFTHFTATGTADRQYAYDLERLGKLPLLPFGINGVTEILALNATEFIVLERSYSAGYGSKGNRVRLFLATVGDAEDTLHLKTLKDKPITYLAKELLFDFNWVKKRLEKRIIDNVEGISFGPKLDNGHSSLILVSDNNFNSFGKQLNQFILLELIIN